MQKLTREQQRAWQINGYLHLEGALSPEEVAFFCRRLDEIRALPGWEPMRTPIGHYAWMDETPDQDPEGFMDRRDRTKGPTGSFTYHRWPRTHPSGFRRTVKG